MQTKLYNYCTIHITTQVMSHRLLCSCYSTHIWKSKAYINPYNIVYVFNVVPYVVRSTRSIYIYTSSDKTDPNNWVIIVLNWTNERLMHVLSVDPMREIACNICIGPESHDHIQNAVVRFGRVHHAQTLIHTHTFTHTDRQSTVREPPTTAKQKQTWSATKLHRRAAIRPETDCC